MGRLAVILGSNALGPGGEEIAAAAADHGAAIVQRHDAEGGGFDIHVRDSDSSAPLAALTTAEFGRGRTLR